MEIKYVSGVSVVPIIEERKDGRRQRKEEKGGENKGKALVWVWGDGGGRKTEGGES